MSEKQVHLVGLVDWPDGFESWINWEKYTRHCLISLNIKGWSDDAKKHGINYSGSPIHFFQASRET